jgi:5'-deoxynucleotidase YfbR-like HD superfamily hydrolase
MTWMLTATGARVDLSLADPAQLSILDIAHSLSQLNRFTGHCSRPYSVAEHSLLVVEIMQSQLGVYQPAALLAGLLHDAHEAYTSDLSSPMKLMLGPEWAVVEANAQRAVLRRFRSLRTYLDWHRAIKAADLIALATERRDLLPASGPVWPTLADIEPADWINLRTRDAMTWQDWRQAFLDRFESLHGAEYPLGDEPTTTIPAALLAPAQPEA